MALLTPSVGREHLDVPPTHRWSPAQRVAFALSAACGVFVFFWRLTTPSVVNDEVIYRIAAAQYAQGVFEANLEHPPLAKLVVGASHVLLGGTLFADRFAGALLGFLTGLLVAATAHAVVRSARVAIAAGLLWWLLPVAPGITHLHVARSVYLDGPMLFFLAASTLAATLAARSDRLRLWVAAGALAGLAASCKLTGVVALAALLPVVVAHRSQLRRVVLHAGAATAAFVVAFLLPYLPMGEQAPSALSAPFLVQLRHAETGHAQLVAGTIYEHPPWWSPFWFQAQYLGWPALAALFLAVAVGIARSRRSQVWPSVAVLSAGVLLVCTSPLKLPQYHVIWVPALCVLAATALRPAARTPPRALPVVGTAVLFAVLAATASAQLVRVATEDVQDYRAASAFLALRVPAGTAITVWGDRGAMAAALQDRPYPDRLPEDGRPAALVVDPTIANRRPHMDVDRWLARHGAGYDAHRFDRLTVYLRR